MTKATTEQKMNSKTNLVSNWNTMLSNLTLKTAIVGMTAFMGAQAHASTKAACLGYYGGELTRVQIVQLIYADSVKTASQLRQMPASWVADFFPAFEALRVDQGHNSWRQGYIDGIKADNRKIELANIELAAKSEPVKPLIPLSKPRPKPVPKNGIADVLAYFKVESVEQLASLHGNYKERFDTLGYTLNVETKALEQDINRPPQELSPALNLKLNGVHKKYAQIVGQFMMNNYQTSRRPSKSDMVALSNQIHEIWMADAAWKVEGVFKKYANITDTFWSLSVADRMTISADILSKNADKVTSDERAALEQFRPYDQLSEYDKSLDDKILADVFSEMSRRSAALLAKRSGQ